VNRKIKVFAIALMAAAMLATPLVGLAQAEQTKLGFHLRLTGFLDGTWDKSWESGINIHRRDAGFVMLGEFFIIINEGEADEQTIEAQFMEYEASMDVQQHPEKGFYCINVREVIYIYSSDTTHDETTLMGTLEIMALGSNKAGNGGTFVGFGTGEFEGVKVQGTSVTTVVAPAPTPVGYMLQLDRTGIVTGWA